MKKKLIDRDFYVVPTSGYWQMIDEDGRPRPVSSAEAQCGLHPLAKWVVA